MVVSCRVEEYITNILNYIYWLVNEAVGHVWSVYSLIVKRTTTHQEHLPETKFDKQLYNKSVRVQIFERKQDRKPGIGF